MSNAGRPSDFKEEHCELLIEHMRNGLSFESFAGVAGCCRKTIYNWLEQHPQFLHAKSVGTGLSAIFWEKAGIDGTLGKIDGFSASTWIFNMKNRFRWADRSETELSTSSDKDKKLVIEFKKEE
jgi:hypothetical protein